LGLVDKKSHQRLKDYEANTQEYMDKGQLFQAFLNWQGELQTVKHLVASNNLYDLSRSQIDMTENNYWHFLQQPHIRKAIHVGDTKFDDGAGVKTRLKILPVLTPLTPYFQVTT
jgi:hypothetical protein